MKLLINTASSYKGGGVQVCKSFIEECKKFPEHEYHIILGVLLSTVIEKEDFPDNFNFYEIGYRPATKVFSFKKHDSFFQRLEDEVIPDCVFTVGGPAYWRPKAFHLMGYTLPHYIYPESPFFIKIPLSQRIKWWLKSIIIKYFIKRDADVYIVQTDDVNKRLRKWINNDNVYTVANAVSSYFLNPSEPKVKMLNSNTANEFRFLMLSAYYTHKNFEILNEVCEILSSEKLNNIRFILTLPVKIYDEIYTATAKEFIYNVGPVEPAECPGLYNECNFVFLPTLLECFSATYVEGFAMNKPIITSDMPFAKTVCNEAALYFDPLNAREIVDKIKYLINSSEVQKALGEKGKLRFKVFNTAEERAAKILDLCNSLCTDIHK